MSGRIEAGHFETPEALDAAFLDEILETDVLLDLGCGIRPFSAFKPRVHLAVEPWSQYIPFLQRRFRTEPGFIPLRLTVPDELKILPDRSVDTVAAMDVIEHLGKEQGVHLLREAERLARRQILIFTPLGFLPQEPAASGIDAWGLGNAELQRHRSGWTPEDFGPGWRFLACPHYHQLDTAQGGTFGAFYAVKTIAATAHRRLPARTLVVSNLALPPAPTDDPVQVSMKRAFRDTFSMIEPHDFAFLTNFAFTPYNSRIVFNLKDYAEWRLPVTYLDLAILENPGLLAQISPGQLLAEGGDDFRHKVHALADRIDAEGIAVILHLDRLNSNFFTAAAAAELTGTPLVAMQLPGEYRLALDLPVVGPLRDPGLTALDLAKADPADAAAAIIATIAKAGGPSAPRPSPKSP